MATRPTRPIDDETVEVSTGPISLNCERARELGWTNHDMTLVNDTLHALSSSTSYVVGMRAGRTRVCPTCECMVPPSGCDRGCTDEATTTRTGMHGSDGKKTLERIELLKKEKP